MSRCIDADALKSKCGDWYVEEGSEEGFIGTIGQLLDKQPTVEPERKTGKWEWLSCTYDRTPCEKRFRCSECYHETIVIGMSDPWDKYCANCGAKMEGTE